jgi:hypothetical protein
MIPAFDIFLMESDGGTLWCGSAASFEEAQTQVRERVASSPGNYIILNQQTGNKLVIECPADGRGHGSHR